MIALGFAAALIVGHAASRACIAALHPPKGALPAPPEPPGANSTPLLPCCRIALVHKASAGGMTARVLQAAALAQSQVESAGGWYRLIYSVHPAPRSSLAAPEATGARAELAALHATLGRSAVIAVGSDDVAAAFGAGLMEEQRRVVGEGEWAWVTNDAVDAAWFLHGGEAAMPRWAAHLWLVEMDVGWTGDLVDALLSTLSMPSTPGAGQLLPCSGVAAAAGAGDGEGTQQGPGVADGAGEGSGGEPDWVAFNTQLADNGWRWFAVRNERAAGPVWRSYRHACRASRRLLHALAAELHAGRVQSDEAGAASVCAAAAWCRAGALCWQPGHPVLGSHPDSGEALYRWDSVIGPELWGRAEAADAAARNCTPAAHACSRGVGAAAERGGCSRLYHKLKW